MLHGLTTSALVEKAACWQDKLAGSTEAGIAVLAKQLLRAMGRPNDPDVPPMAENPRTMVGSSLAG